MFLKFRWGAVSFGERLAVKVPFLIIIVVIQSAKIFLMITVDSLAIISIVVRSILLWLEYFSPSFSHLSSVLRLLPKETLAHMKR